MPRIGDYTQSSSTDNNVLFLVVGEDGQTYKMPLSIIKSLVNDAEALSTFETLQMVIQDSSVGVGQMGWNDTEGTLDIGLKGGNVILQTGTEMVARVRNDTGTAISDGTVVQYAGGIGASGQIRVSKFTASPSSSPLYMLGVTTEEIANGEDGWITIIGKVRGVTLTVPELETWNLGDVLYASPYTAGGFTNVEPEAPNLKVPIGVINAISGSNYTIIIRPVLSPKLASMNDIYINSLSNQHILQYNSVTSRWENKAITDNLVISQLQSDVAALGSGISYRYNTSFVGGDPGSGYFSLNNDPGSTTVMYVDDSSYKGDSSAYIGNLGAGDIVRLSTREGEPALMFVVDSVTDQSGYWEIAHTTTLQFDEYLLAQNEEVVITIISKNVVDSVSNKSDILIESLSGDPTATWDIDFSSKDLYSATGFVEPSQATSITFSNIASGGRATIMFSINNVSYTLSFPSDDAYLPSTDTRWNSSTGVWTASETGDYKMEIYTMSGVCFIEISDSLTNYVV